MTNIRPLLGLGLVAALAACDADELTNANRNPNSPTDAPSEALFTSAARNGVGRWQDGIGGTRYTSFAQHFAEVQYPESDQYTRLRASGTSGLFNASYNVELQDLQIVIDRGRAANNPGLWAPAEVLQTWELGILTDAFGDIPYKDAFRADELVLQPTYDPQKEVYDSLFVALTAASTALGGASNALGSGDPIYGGDPAGWRKFANSLRLRHALRLVNVDPTTASAQIQAARTDAGGLIDDNAENAKLQWPGDGIYDNPWANNFKTRDDHRISQRLLTYLSSYNDPRLAVYAMPAGRDTVEIAGKTLKACPGGGSSCYVGLVPGLTHGLASPLVAYTSRPGAIFYPGVTAYGTFGGSGGSFPSFLQTAAEVNFALAEAAERGLGGLTQAQAAGYYNTAITRSMEMWGISATAIAAYLAQPSVAYSGAATSADRQKRIAIQKWLALIVDPIQAWSEVRRTCQPAIVEPGPNAAEANLPRRLYYSTNERAVNATNVNAAVQRLVGATDNFRSRMYWDTKPTDAPTYEAGCSTRTS